MSEDTGKKKVIVVGAGIFGASAAYHLARDGAEVVLVDENIDGQATAAGAGIVCPWLSHPDNPDWYLLAAKGAKYYSELISCLAEDGEADTGYSKSSAIAVSDKESDIDEAEALAKKRRDAEPLVGEIQRITGEEAAELFPPIDSRLLALQISGGAKIDGRKFRRALTRAAQKRNVRFIRGKAAIESSGGRIIGVRIGRDRLRSDCVIVAAGAWTPNFLAPLGIRYDVHPQKGQIIHLSYPYENTAEWPVILPLINTHYILTFSPNKVVIGATRENGSGFDYRVTAAGVHEILTEAFRVAPGLSEAEIAEIRVGFRPFGPDILPLIGKLPGWDGLVIATGLGASGLTLGPYAGRLAAEIALGKETDLDLRPYAPAQALLKRI